MPNLPNQHFKNFPGERFKDLPKCGFGYLCNVHIRSAGEIMNYFDFYSMQADSLYACVPISVLNSFLTKMLVRQVGHVTIDLLDDNVINWKLILIMWFASVGPNHSS